MRVLAFDIETYKEHFVCCGILADNETHEELGRFKTGDHGNFCVDGQNLQDIEDMFSKADYIISYNGSKFDLPVLAKVKHDVKKMGYTTSKFIYADANDIMGANDFATGGMKIYHELWCWRRLLRVPLIQGDPTSPF